MNAKKQELVKELIQGLLSNVESIQELTDFENSRLLSMDARRRILGNKEFIIVRDTQCMDNARLSIQDAINELSKIFEPLS